MDICLAALIVAVVALLGLVAPFSAVVSISVKVSKLGSSIDD